MIMIQKVITAIVAIMIIIENLMITIIVAIKVMIKITFYSLKFLKPIFYNYE